MSEASSRSYPASVPFEPALASSARLRHWVLWLALGAMAGLVCTLAVGLLLLLRTNRQLDSARATLDESLATQFYQTYLNLTLLADATENETYNDIDAQELLSTVIGILDRMDLQLNRLVESGAKAEDANLEAYRRLSRLLRTQTVELRAYWRTGDQAKAQKWKATREESWALIRELMEIQE